MKAKIFTSLSEISLEKKINEFLALESKEVLNVKYQVNIFIYSVLILYKERPPM